MFRIDDPSASATLPVPEAAGTEAYFTEGAPGVTAATLVRASWLNMIQEELRAIVVAGGLTPLKTTYNQVLNGIKALMQSSAGNYALDTGTANVYQVAYAPAITAISDGMILKFKAKTANTGASTFSANGLTAAPIWGGDHAALTGGEIVANGDVWLQWNSALNGTGAWVLIDSTGGFLKSPSPTSADNSAKVATTSWFYSAIATVATAAGFAVSLTANGYIKFPTWLGGWIVQWGANAGTTSGPSTFSYPIQFPNQVFGMLGQVINVSSAYTSRVAAVSTSQFQIGNFNGTVWAADNVFWAAIGR